VEVNRVPKGVVGIISPWNYPFTMALCDGLPALLAGNAVVIKPAPQTPRTTLRLAELFAKAGAPEGLVQAVTGNAEVGQALVTDPGVDMVSVTGSTETGRVLMRQSADTIKKLSLELGGNAPFIVFDDADLDAAVEGALASKYRNAGQTCVCANRLYVQDGVYDAFAKKLAEKVSGFKVGAGNEPGVVIGPLIDEQGLKKVETHVADALKHGAKVMLGGKRHERGGLFFEPTVLTNVTPQMLVSHEETFGPVAPLIRFRTEEEVIALANDSEFGLSGYFYSRDVGRIFRVAEQMETGIVGANVGIISTEIAPFGGVKQSGLGREGSKYGLEEYMEIKYILVGGLDK
jgi:succinate-semialdehyde dehydrogenase/glutarate-semialdehyde dehydrogenase